MARSYYGTELRRLIVQMARRHHLDPHALLAVATVEGGFHGAIGDHGTSYGPFQLHRGGALPGGKDAAWANTRAGVAYAVRRIAGVARGKSGREAVSSIVYSFERPAAPANEVERAMSVYRKGGAVGVGGGQLVHYARKFLGTPYKWGGTTPSGFDCSGFVQYLYAHFGIDLPRTTYQQVKVGQRVRHGKYRPGDLLFFEPSSQGPAHEGMYIGNGKFIEAPHTGDVVKIRDLAGYLPVVAARRLKGVAAGIGGAVSADLPPASSAAEALGRTGGTSKQLPTPQDFGFSLPGGFAALPGQPSGTAELPGMGGSFFTPQSAQNWQLLGNQVGSSPETQAFAQRAQLYNQVGQ